MEHSTSYVPASHLAYNPSSPHCTPSYADSRAASSAQRQQRQKRKKYLNWRYFSPDDIASGNNAQFAVPAGTELWHPRFVRETAEAVPVYTVTGGRQLHKCAKILHAASSAAAKPPRRFGDRVRSIGHRPWAGELRGEWLSEKQKWDVDAGEQDGLREAQEYFDGFECTETDPVSEILWGLPHQELEPALLPADEHELDVVENDEVSDWYYVDNWLNVLSGDEADSESEAWDVLSDECGGAAHLFD